MNYTACLVPRRRMSGQPRRDLSRSMRAWLARGIPTYAKQWMSCGSDTARTTGASGIRPGSGCGGHPSVRAPKASIAVMQHRKAEAPVQYPWTQIGISATPLLQASPALRTEGQRPLRHRRQRCHRSYEGVLGQRRSRPDGSQACPRTPPVTWLRRGGRSQMATTPPTRGGRQRMAAWNTT